MRPTRVSQATVFAALMVVALALSLLPVAATQWIRSLAQPLAYLESPIRSVALSVKQRFSTESDGRLSEEAAQALRQENDELRRQLAAYDQAFVALDRRVAEVTGVSQQFAGTGAKIIIARVVAPSADPRQGALRLSKGSMAGVKQAQWVAAGTAGGEGASGRELLTRQWLIGRITEVRPYESVVMLTSDHRFKEYVRVGRLEAAAGGGWVWATGGEKCLLTGAGESGMVIGQAMRDYRPEEGWLVMVPESRALPLALALGRVTGSRKVDETQLHFDLTVEACGRVEDLEYVYIVDVGS